MEEEDTKTCDNCKRDIPAINFTIHTVHCARNIKVCPVCKEPVPHAELAEHHEKLHKLLPCKQCGESVCGTDLEDHIRDSCGHTIKSCRFCSLEVARRDLPAHECYCGARTERCADCGEFVMIKYRQIHLDSNHGFLRLDDDPDPRLEPPRPTNRQPITFANTSLSSADAPALSKVTYVDRPQTTIRYFNGADAGASTSGVANSIPSTSTGLPSASVIKNEFPPLPGGSGRPPAKRDNHQPQINTAVHAKDKINKDLSISRGAVKKRPAPKPPAREPPTRDPRREAAYHSALQRSQQEERQRKEQSERNLAAGLPPVLSAAAKLDKLRKMDALHNRETDNTDYKNKLQGRIWMPPDIPVGQRLGSEPNPDNNTNIFAERRRIKREPVSEPVAHSSRDERNGIVNTQNEIRKYQNVTSTNQENCQNEVRKSQNEVRNCQNGARNFQNEARNDQNEARNRQKEARSWQNEIKNCKTEYRNCQSRSGNSENAAVSENRRSEESGSNENRRVKRVIDKSDLRNIQPMSAEQFLTRFTELTVGKDRFTDIKSQLTQLRRGLNEVTAPYNSNSTNNHREERSRRRSPASPASPEASPRVSPEQDDGTVELPCEFCTLLVPAEDLVQHQTGCRPDLARLSPTLARVSRSRSQSRSRSPSPAPLDPPECPVIPCEFCSESLPLYLINDHQEQCGRDHNLLYAD